MEKLNITNSDLTDIRDANKTDFPFILATWLRGLRFGNNWFRLINAEVYFSVYHAVIEHLLTKPTIKIKISCLREDPEVILGFSVYEDSRLHWVYVKQAWRNIGIARALVPNTITVVSHLTDVGKALMQKNKLAFNPFLL